MYSVFLYNLGYYLQDVYHTEAHAKAAGIRSGFEFIIEVKS